MANIEYFIFILSITIVILISTIFTIINNYKLKTVSQRVLHSKISLVRMGVKS